MFYYIVLIMVEYLWCFVLFFSVYFYCYRFLFRGIWGVFISVSVVRDMSICLMILVGFLMVRWWRRNIIRCYVGNLIGVCFVIIIFIDKIVICYFFIGLKMFKKFVLKVVSVWGYKESFVLLCVLIDFFFCFVRFDLNRRDVMFLFYWIL